VPLALVQHGQLRLPSAPMPRWAGRAGGPAPRAKWLGFRRSLDFDELACGVMTTFRSTSAFESWHSTGRAFLPRRRCPRSPRRPAFERPRRRAFRAAIIRRMATATRT